MDVTTEIKIMENYRIFYIFNDTEIYNGNSDSSQNRKIDFISAFSQTESDFYYKL